MLLTADAQMLLQVSRYFGTQLHKHQPEWSCASGSAVLAFQQPSDPPELPRVSRYLQEQGIYSGSCTPTTVNHALLVVGYNQMATDEKYWILRNQWGSDWGADGYIYLPINEEDDDKTGGPCGLLGVQNGFPPVYTSMSSGALALQMCGLLVMAALSAMLLVSA